jgi:hypothetical protein
VENLEYAYTEPVREFARKRGISPTKVYRWIASGELESFLEGKRRHVVVSSYDRLVRRRVVEQGSVMLRSSNPKFRERQGATSEASSIGSPTVKQQIGVIAPPRRRGKGRSRRATAQ